MNITKELSFSDNYFKAIWITNVEDYPIKERTIVINIGTQKADIVAPVPKSLLPRTSVILNGVQIKQADSLILITELNTTNIGGITLQKGWELAGNVIPQYPKNIPLWKSSQDTLNVVEFDPYVATGQADVPKIQKKFQVKVNLWFATDRTNCSIHNLHDFLEVHTQIYGRGRMQKFTQQDFSALYEDAIVSPGDTHLPFANVADDGKFVYPWHQYYADTNTIWLAIEYHPVSDRSDSPPPS
jgi:hypothetical protein